LELFHVTEDITFSIPFDTNTVSVSVQKPRDKLDVKSIYVSTGACIEIFKSQIQATPQENLPKDFKFKILDKATKNKIFGIKNFPRFLSNFDSSVFESEYAYTDPTNFKTIPTTPFIPLEEKIKDINKDEIKVFIINGMGTGLGDGIVGLTALNIFYKRLEKKYKRITIDIGQPSIIGDSSHKDLYSQESIINNLSYLPITVEKLLEYDLVMDNSAMIIRDNFPKNTMLDFFLENLSIDKNSVPLKEKQNWLQLSSNALAALEMPFRLARQNSYLDYRNKNKLILLHTSASSPIRSIPRDKIKHIIKNIIDTDKDYIVITWENLDDVIKEINDLLGPKKHRHINFNFLNSSFDRYVAAISKIDALVTIDTSSYHIANSFNKPSIVLFSTINPELRISNYPLCKAIEVKADNTLDGIHVSVSEEHLAKNNKNWENFNIKQIGTELKTLLKLKNKEECPIIICPTCDRDLSNNRPSDKLGNKELFYCDRCHYEFRNNKNIDFSYHNNNIIENAKLQNLDLRLKEVVKEEKYKTVIDFLQTFKGHNLNLLDYGCGIGDLVRISTNLGYIACGYDTDKNIIEFGKNFYNLQNQLFYTDNTLLGKYDVITCVETLEFNDYPVEIIKKLSSQLKDDGFLVLVTNNLNTAEHNLGIKNRLIYTNEIAAFVDRHSITSHKELVSTVYDLSPLYQKSSEVNSNIIEHLRYPMPNVTVNVNDQIVTIDGNNLKAFTHEFYAPLAKGIENGGKFITTIFQKHKAI